jgi:hypothetical protein
MRPKTGYFSYGRLTNLPRGKTVFKPPQNGYLGGYFSPSVLAHGAEFLVWVSFNLSV